MEGGWRQEKGGGRRKGERREVPFLPACLPPCLPALLPACPPTRMRMRSAYAGE